MEKSTTEKTEWPTVAEQEAFWKAKENDGPYDGYWRPQDDPHIPDERRLSLEDRKVPADSTLADKETGLSLDKVEATTNYYDHRECPNCGRNYDSCQGNCIFDQLPNRGWAEPEWTLRDEVGESYGEIP